jgi:hypothetical protein
MKSSFVIVGLVGIINSAAFGQPAPIPQADIELSKAKLVESLKKATGSKAIFMGESMVRLSYWDKNSQNMQLGYDKMVEGYKQAAQDEKVFKTMIEEAEARWVKFM